MRPLLLFIDPSVIYGLFIGTVLLLGVVGLLLWAGGRLMQAKRPGWLHYVAGTLLWLEAAVLVVWMLQVWRG